MNNLKKVMLLTVFSAIHYSTQFASTAESVNLVSEQTTQATKPLSIEEQRDLYNRIIRLESIVSQMQHPIAQTNQSLSDIKRLIADSIQIILKVSEVSNPKETNALKQAPFFMAFSEKHSWVFEEK